MNSAPRALIGREASFRDASRVLDEAKRGAGSLVIVSGPAGIGRTRFLERVLERAESQGFRAAQTSNYSAVRAPFGPIADLVRELAPAAAEATPSLATDKILLGRFLGTAEVSADAPVDRRRLFVVLGDFFSRATSKSPLIVSIDDAQWADPESVEFLHFLATRVPNSRLVILVAIRDDGEEESDAELGLSLGRFSRAVAIRLGPLDDASARQLVAFHERSNRPMPRQTVDAMCKLAEGNPLLLSELIRSVGEDGEQFTVPRSVELLVQRRLGALEPSLLRIVEIGAALGRSFSLEHLMSAADISSVDALRALRAARDTGLLREDRSKRDVFVFHNEIARTVAYDHMFASEREIVHRRIANLLEELGASPDLLSDHWRRAGQPERSSWYAERAGDAAIALGAFASARDRYAEGLADGITGEDRARVAQKSASACSAIGEVNLAISRLREAIRYFAAGGSSQRVAELECELSNVIYRSGDVEGAIAAAERVLLLDATAETKYTALASLATYCAHRPDIDGAIRFIEAANQMPSGRTLRQEIRLEWARAIVAAETSDEDWREPAEKSMRLAESGAPALTFALTATNFAVMARKFGRADLARIPLERAIVVANENGLLLASAFAKCIVLEDLFEQGQLALGESCLRDVVAMQIDAPLIRNILAAKGLPLVADLGIADEFVMIADESLVDLALAMGEKERIAEIAAAFVHLAGVGGRLDFARSLIDRALDAIPEAGLIFGWTFFTFARFGSSEQIVRVQNMFESQRRRRGDRAYRFLVDALYARALSDEARLRASLRSGIIAAESDGFELLVAFGKEMQGQRADALAIYERVGARSHVLRLAPPPAILTKREREIAGYLRRGLSNRAIARELTLSERTIENHVASLFGKLGVRTRAEFLTSSDAPDGDGVRS